MYRMIFTPSQSAKSNNHPTAITPTPPPPNQSNTNTNTNPNKLIPTPTGEINQIMTELSKAAFAEELQKNERAILIKFGAEWCGPCKQIDPLVHQLMRQMPLNIKCYVLDIDDEASFDLYAFLKSKRMVNGVPVLLCYKKGNLSWVPTDVIVGANPEHVKAIFERALI